MMYAYESNRRRLDSSNYHGERTPHKILRNALCHKRSGYLRRDEVVRVNCDGNDETNNKYNNSGNNNNNIINDNNISFLLRGVTILYVSSLLLTNMTEDFIVFFIVYRC